jgi:hypothetical protein
VRDSACKGGARLPILVLKILIHRPWQLLFRRFASSMPSQSLGAARSTRPCSGGGNTSGAASNDDNAHLACSSHTDAVMSTATLMSSLLVEHGRHLLGDHTLDEPDRVGLGQSLGSRYPK